MVKIKVYNDDGESRVCSIIAGQVVTKNQGKVLCTERALIPDGFEDGMVCYIIMPPITLGTHMRKYDYEAISKMVNR